MKGLERQGYAPRQGLVDMQRIQMSKGTCTAEMIMDASFLLAAD